MSFLLCFYLVQGSGFRVQGLGGGFAAFFIGRCPEVEFESPVTSHSYDTREGIVSHAWYEILRLSPHLFWLGVFSHRVFLSAGVAALPPFFIGRCPKVVFKSRVTSHNNDMSSPLEKGRAKGAGWIHEAV